MCCFGVLETFLIIVKVENMCCLTFFVDMFFFFCFFFRIHLRVCLKEQHFNLKNGITVVTDFQKNKNYVVLFTIVPKQLYKE